MRQPGLWIAICAAIWGCGDLDEQVGGADAGPGQGDAGPPTDGAQPTGELVDPSCTDGMYTEVLPDVDADLGGVSFTGDLGSFVDAVLAIRYPVGALLVAGGRTFQGFEQDCDVLFAGSAQSAAAVFGRMSVIVHECAHFYDVSLSTGASDSYFIHADLTLSCTRGDSQARGGDTFARSLLNGDDYSVLRPPCVGGVSGCDRYATTYLDGDPNDGTFDGGDQGFNMLFEEAVQYVNSLATSWAFVDQMSPGQRTSARDGILTFLWWIERYLRMARLEHPAAYARITDACWRDAILTLWGRAWLFLEATSDLTPLGIDHVELLELVSDPDLLSEIQRLRDLEGC